MTGWYRRFIQNYAQTAEPLHKCLRKDRTKKFELSEEAVKAFEVLKTSMATAPVLVTPDLSGRLARWSLKLKAFDFTIEHRKGSLNVVPDALSQVHMDELQKNWTYPSTSIRQRSSHRIMST